MSDFLAMLVSRNLGEGAGVPDRAAEGVRPRPAAAFEPEGSGVAVAPAGEELPPDVAEAAPDVVGVTPVTQVPEPAPALTRLMADPPASQEKPAVLDPVLPRQRRPGVAEPAPVREPELAPVRPVASLPESRGAPALEPTPPPVAPPAVPGEAAPTASHGPEPAPVRPPLPPLPESRIGRPESPSEAPPRPALSPQPPSSPQPSVESRRRADPPLERIVRQMVLSPRPDPVPPRADETPPSHPAARSEQSAPPPSVSPSLASRDIRPAPTRASTSTVREAPRLSPVPEPQRLPDRPPETTVRISIGRIEVRTGADAAAETARRPQRPQAELMSLDDYLARRAEEG